MLGGSSLAGAPAFFPLLQDPAALYHAQERALFMREEEKIASTQASMDRCQQITDDMVSTNQSNSSCI